MFLRTVAFLIAGCSGIVGAQGIGELSGSRATRQLEITPRLRLTNPDVQDQDDMCFFRDASGRENHRIIVSDKSADRIWCYDAHGTLHQQIELPQPGNIDLRRGFQLDGADTTIVAVNDRRTRKIAVFTVNSEGQLHRVDDDRILTQENYGGGLVTLPDSGRCFFISTSKESGVEQIELFDNGQGQIGGRRVHHWPLGMCEAAVADDETGMVYVAVEQEGIVRIDADPDRRSDDRWLFRVGEHGLVGDVEGLALATTERSKFLIVSDQGASRFRIYQLNEPVGPVGSLRVHDAERTDGVDLVMQDLGPLFPRGAIACHTDKDGGHSLLVTPADALHELFDTRTN